MVAWQQSPLSQSPRVVAAMSAEQMQAVMTQIRRLSESLVRLPNNSSISRRSGCSRQSRGRPFGVGSTRQGEEAHRQGDATCSSARTCGPSAASLRPAPSGRHPWPTQVAPHAVHRCQSCLLAKSTVPHHFPGRRLERASGRSWQQDAIASRRNGCLQPSAAHTPFPNIARDGGDMSTHQQYTLLFDRDRRCYGTFMDVVCPINSSSPLLV